METTTPQTEDWKAQAKETLDGFKNRAKDQADKACSFCQDGFSKMKECSVAEAKEKLVTHVKEHPIRTAAVLAGIGALIGTLIAVRRRK